MTQNATLLLNGEEHPYAPGMTVASLVASLAESPAGVAVEINGDILSPELFARRRVQPGETLEIIRFVGGG